MCPQLLASTLPASVPRPAMRCSATYRRAEASGSLVPLEGAGFAEPGELAGAPEKQMRQRIGEVVPSSIVCCLIKEWCVKQRPLWHTAALYRDNTKQLRFGGLRSSAYLRFNTVVW